MAERHAPDPAPGRDGADPPAARPVRLRAAGRMSCPVSTPGSGSGWLILVEECLEAVVGGGVVGEVVLPAAPDDVRPGSREDADGVRVVAAAGDGLVVEGGGPGAGPAGIAGEVAQGVAQLLVGSPAERDGLDLARLAGGGGDPGQAGQGVAGGEAAAGVADLGGQPGRADGARAGQGREDHRVRAGPAQPAASQRRTGACYRALRCLPERDSHPSAWTSL